MLKIIIVAVALFATTASAEPIKNGVVGILTAGDMPFIIAREKGMFKSKNLDIAEDINFSNNATVQTALITGDIQFAGTTAMFNIIQSRYNGSDVIWGRSINTGPGILLYSKAEIKSINDLKGKFVSAGGQNDNTRLFAEIILNQGKLTYDDVEWFWSGSASQRLLALKTGRIDAAMLFPPFSDQAEKDGYRNLGVTSDYKMVANKGLAFNKTWAKNNPGKVNDILDAIDESVMWLYDVANLDEAASILSVYTKGSIEESKLGIKFYIDRNLYERSRNIYNKDIDYYVDVSRKWGNIKSTINIPNEQLVWDSSKLK
jgi:ABC-type nitrate/sulfonate/bicarbonate transport system substrate-binding protein